MIRITNLLVLLIVTLFILPASAVMYASGSSDGSSDGTSDTGSSDGSSDGTSDTGSSDGSSDGTSDTGSSDGSSDGTSDTGSTTSNNTGNEQQQGADFENTILNIHNQERAAVNNPALSWSSSLAADAQSWADHITTLGLGPNDLAPHATWEQRNGQGENLAWGSVGFFTPAEGVQMWAAEKSNYDGHPISASDFAPGVPMIGHYTQMVWKDTTQIGCGIASDAGQTYLVCRYSPAGNYMGQTPY